MHCVYKRLQFFSFCNNCFIYKTIWQLFCRTKSWRTADTCYFIIKLFWNYYKSLFTKSIWGGQFSWVGAVREPFTTRFLKIRLSVETGSHACSNVHNHMKTKTFLSDFFFSFSKKNNLSLLYLYVLLFMSCDRTRFTIFILNNIKMCHR